ncbi:MAG TPA: hypothetical protein VLT33_12960 [Labilithrix sp.]|nr:hypothetical protein [Labilithrix sp.]
MSLFRVAPIVGLLVLGACSKKAPPAGETPSPSASSAITGEAGAAAAPAATAAAPPRVATAKPFVASFPVPPFKGKFPHQPDPSVDEAGRVVEVTYAGPGSETEAPLFKLTNRSGKKLSVNQTWLFYYDATGKRLDRYPHSLSGSLTIEPGETKEHRLGRDMKDMKPGVVTYEGEVTSATVGGDPWFNDNLTEERPKGGLSPDDLLATAGERVIVEIYDLTSFKARLTNVTDRAVNESRVKVLYYDAKGQVVKGVPTLETVAIEPGKSVDVTLHPAFDSDKKGPPAKAISAAAFAPTVRFADGKTFENENLSSQSRKAPAK